MSKADTVAFEYAKENGTLGLDYNQIYDAVKHGYKQAEKDNELTWEDMREIYYITLNLREHLGASVFGEPLYQEVLKRFKERKEE